MVFNCVDFRIFKIKRMEKFIITTNGTRLFTRWFQNDVTPRAIIILVHGIGEHIHRYNDWATLFNSDGIFVLGADLPGHGRSEGRRGHIRSFSEFFEVIDLLVAESASQFPGVPQFIYGHSMGGNIALNYILKKKPSFKGAIITSPWLKLSTEPPRLLLLVAQGLRSVFPSMLQNTGLITDYLSHDPEVIRKYRRDPMVHGKISVALFLGSRGSAAWNIENAGSLELPTLMIHGKEDKICSPKGSEIFASRADKAEFVLWDEGFHELHNEPFRLEVYGVILKWINERLDEE